MRGAYRKERNDKLGKARLVVVGPVNCQREECAVTINDEDRCTAIAERGRGLARDHDASGDDDDDKEPSLTPPLLTTGNRLCVCRVGSSEWSSFFCWMNGVL